MAGAPALAGGGVFVSRSRRATVASAPSWDTQKRHAKESAQKRHAKESAEAE